MKEKSDQYKEWQTRITAFQASGKTIAAWCRINDFKVHQLQYWLQKQRSESEPSSKPAQWLSVEIKHADADSKELPLLVKVGSTTIEVHPGFNAELLLDVVRILSITC